VSVFVPSATLALATTGGASFGTVSTTRTLLPCRLSRRPIEGKVLPFPFLFQRGACPVAVFARRFLPSRSHRHRQA